MEYGRKRGPRVRIPSLAFLLAGIPWFCKVFRLYVSTYAGGVGAFGYTRIKAVDRLDIQLLLIHSLVGQIHQIIKRLSFSGKNYESDTSTHLNRMITISKWFCSFLICCSADMQFSALTSNSRMPINSSPPIRYTRPSFPRAILILCPASSSTASPHACPYPPSDAAG